MSIQNLGFNYLRAGSTVNAATSGAVTINEDEVYTGFTTNATANITSTLADGIVCGQIKIIELMVRDSSNLVVTFNGQEGNTLTFDSNNEFALMVWGCAKWHVIYTNATISTA